jgi:hypothetical protein
VADVADTWVRRKIASITQNGILNRTTPQVLRRYAAKFDLEVQVENGKIVLPAAKKKFRRVLNLLDEDLLSFEPTDERWVVNSKRRYQFRLSEYISRRNASFIADGTYASPYYWLSLHRKDNSQLKALVHRVGRHSRGAGLAGPTASAVSDDDNIGVEHVLDGGLMDDGGRVERCTMRQIHGLALRDGVAHIVEEQFVGQTGVQRRDRHTRLDGLR